MRKILSALIILAGMLILSACSTAQQPSPTPAPVATRPPAATSTAAPPTATPAPTATPTPIRKDKVSIVIDWIEPAGKHAPLYVAIEKGFYASAGLDVEVKTGRGSMVALQLVANKSNQFGFATGDTVVTAVQGSMPVRSVAAIYQGNPASVMGRTSKNNVKSPKDLEGLTIGISAGAPMYDLFPVYLKAAGVDANKVKTPTYELQLRHNLAVAGEIDGMVATLEGLAYVEDAGGGWALKFSDAGMEMLGHAIVAHNDLIKENPDLVRRFVTASIKGFEYAQKNASESIDIETKYNPNLKKSIWQRALEINMEGLHTKNSQGKPIGWSSEADWKNMESYLIKYTKPEWKELDASKYMTNEFVAK